MFYYSATVSDEMAARVEAEIADLEVAAVPTADPTPDVHQVISSARESGRIIGVVSNNGPTRSTPTRTTTASATESA